MNVDKLLAKFDDPEFKESWDKMYDNWINKNYPTPDSAIAKCADVTLKMQKAYPWLERVRGVVHTINGEHLHWWLECHLIDRIIDPTAKQFTLISFYEKLPDEDPRCIFPRKKCMNCGVEFFSQYFACSKRCDKELEEAFS
jgi:hypothetical protein